MTDETGTTRIAAFDLPASNTIEWSVHDIVRRRAERRSRLIAEMGAAARPDWKDPVSILAWRERWAQAHLVPLSAEFEQRYDVEITPRTVAGVPAELIAPRDVAGAGGTRILVNLHGGGFIHGGRWAGRMESIPIAAHARCPVLSVDYRLAPESRFPAATLDVVSVFRELLDERDPEQIGMFGSSAGALLAAQTVARLIHDGLPLPGAIGMFSGAASWYSEGDSGRISAAIQGRPYVPPSDNLYFAEADLSDPLVFPVRSDHLMSRFPPALLVAATRDTALSSVAHTHSRLVALGVPAELHVWDGLDHVFFYEPDLPQSSELFTIAGRFFERTLGARSR